MFIDSTAYEATVRRVLKGAGPASIAVAFWGNGAEGLLAGRTGPTRVICNLRSGACSPKVIRAVLDMPHVELLQHDRLHAKIVTCAGAALVGSANFSANGLGFEGAEVVGWQEAAILTRTRADVEAAQAWFDARWLEATRISPADIKRAHELWLPSRWARSGRQGHDPRAPFDLSKLAMQEVVDTGVDVIINRRSPGSQARRAARAIYKGESPPIYEGWNDLRKDQQLIDLYWPKEDPLECTGVFTVRALHSFSYTDGTKGKIQVCDKQNQVLSRKFGAAEAARLVRALKPHWSVIWDKARGDDDGKLISLAEVLEIVAGRRQEGA